MLFLFMSSPFKGTGARLVLKITAKVESYCQAEDIDSTLEIVQLDPNP